jgi:hypothetical protein
VPYKAASSCMSIAAGCRQRSRDANAESTPNSELASNGTARAVSSYDGSYDHLVLLALVLVYNRDIRSRPILMPAGLCFFRSSQTTATTPAQARRVQYGSPHGEGSLQLEGKRVDLDRVFGISYRSVGQNQDKINPREVEEDHAEKQAQQERINARLALRSRSLQSDLPSAATAHSFPA